MTTSQVMCKFELESFKEVASNHKEKKEDLRGYRTRDNDSDFEPYEFKATY